ncbi:MAG: A24 family peptidase [Clostridia bacterium]|nr:A24 family peptidase [Clostridia bacterium]
MNFDKIVFLFFVLAFNVISFYMLHTYKNNQENETVEVVGKRFLYIYSAIFFLVNIAIAVFIMCFYKTNSFLFSLKRVCLLSLLWPIGLIDFKTYKIPNKFILLGLIYRCIIIIAEIIFERKYIVGNLISEVIAAIGLALAAFLCSICMKNSIGYGDIKLFIVMGLLLGLNGIWSAIFASLIVAFLTAVFLLITKKKGRKDVVPFAPSIMIGTYISIILTGM